MPFLFIVVGVVMLVSAVRNTNGQIVTLIKGDFTGKGNFFYWTAAMGVLGGLGYVPQLRTLSRWFMALVIVVLFLKNGGVFSQFVAAINGEAAGADPASSGGAQINTGSSSSQSNGLFTNGFSNATGLNSEGYTPQDVIANASEPATGLDTTPFSVSETL